VRADADKSDTVGEEPATKRELTMIVLLVVVAWILIVSMISALCLAARAGDRLQPAGAPAGWEEPTEAGAWEPVEISARSRLRPADASASRLRRDGVAA
jgi:hypothetical protein